MAIFISFLGILLISTHGDLLLFHLTSAEGFHWLSAALFYGQFIGSST